MKHSNPSKREVYVCPICGKCALLPASTPKCMICRVRMEYCGQAKEYTKISMMSVKDRIRLANSE